MMLPRVLLIGLALVLAAAGAWVATSELLHPTVPYFPMGAHEADEFARARAELEKAAQLGLVRGEFWTDYALALRSERNASANSPQEHFRRVRQAAETAVRLAPHDARAWLLLAELRQGTGDAAGTILALKMSYFTGFNDVLLARPRIAIATTASAIEDNEVRQFAAREVEGLLKSPQHGRAVLADIYAGASTEGKRFLDTVLAQGSAHSPPP